MNFKVVSFCSCGFRCNVVNKYIKFKRISAIATYFNNYNFFLEKNHRAIYYLDLIYCTLFKSNNLFRYKEKYLKKIKALS